jgi:N-methylhydantoinase A
MRVGIDIGGTFTDLVAATDDEIVVVKVPSTPDDPSRAFGAALDRVDGVPDEVRHGTTVATNAVLTRSGARLGFVTTEGFRHLLHLGRQNRPSLYDMRARRPEPLVERERCIGVPERLSQDGSVVRELDEAAAREAIASLRGVQGVVVTLLHSYADPKHERRVSDIVREVLGDDVTVSASCDVLPEFREYERASTTALNAYVQPVLSRYLSRIQQRVHGGRVGIMWSGGGVRDVTATIELPVHTLMSGPAAGVLGAAWISNLCDVPDVVTLDMGGTSTDVALVGGGRPAVAEQSELDGLPFRTPCIDVVSVGAGGGSIGWVDEGGALRVGPGSAGAEPGPACYGRGGTEATVTDAQVVLGYLGAEGLAGGELKLDDRAARAAVERLGERAALTVDETAEGILRVVRATMARAIRSVSVERGKDVRRYALVAFGGAGPLHATALARELGITRVLVPPAPGTLAALGLLVASRRSDVSLSRPMTCARERDAELRSILHELTEQALAEVAREGIDFAHTRTDLAVDCRYEGQSHELRVPVRGGPSFALLAEAFHRAHAERFGFSRPKIPVEAVTFRVTALGPSASVPTGTPSGGKSPEPIARRRIGSAEVPVYGRADLSSGAEIDGPAVIVELDSTTWLDEGSRASVHPTGTLIVEVRS